MNRKHLWIIFLVAVLWRLVIAGWLTTLDTNFPIIGGDARGYETLAHNILNEGTLYPDEESELSLRRPPGYPAFVALFFGVFGGTVGPYIISLIQILLWGLTALLLYKIVLRFTSEKVALWAALIFSIEPNAAYYSTLLLSESLFVSLVVLGSYFLFFEKRAFVAGLLIGASALVRPITQFFPLYAILPLLVVHGFSKTTLKRLSLALIGFLIIVTPWAVRNKIVVGSLDISSSGVSTYYRYVLPSFIAFTDGGNYEVIRDGLIENFEETTEQPQAYMSRILKEHVLAQPFHYAFFHSVKTLPFFLSDGIREVLLKNNIIDAKQPNFTLLFLQGRWDFVGRELGREPSFLLAPLGALIWSVVGLLCLSVIWLYRKTSHKEFRLVFVAALIVLYFAFLTGPATSTRHRMPALPWIATLAAIGAYSIRERAWRQTKTKS